MPRTLNASPEDAYAGNEAFVEPSNAIATMSQPAAPATPWLLYALIALGIYLVWND